MKCAFKRGIGIILSLALMLTLVPATAFAASPLTAEVTNVAVEGTAGKTVNVDVTLTSNPGIIVAGLDVSFNNSLLKLVAVTNAGLLQGFSSYTLDFTDANNRGTYRLAWTDWLATSNNTSIGKIATLTFEVLADASLGDTVIGLAAANESALMDCDGKYVKGSFSAGSVTLYRTLSDVTLTGNVTTPVKLQSDASTVTGDGVTADVSWSPALVDGKFAPSTEYTATVNVKASEGYRFADSPTFTWLNGFSDFTRQADGSYSASKTFAATAAKELSGIAITTAPTKTAYEVGNTFDPAGMVVTATYDDGTTAVVNDYSYTPDGTLAGTNTGITVITVSYSEGEGESMVTMTATQEISVSRHDVPASGTLADTTTPAPALTYNGEDQQNSILNTVTMKEGMTGLAGELTKTLKKLVDNVYQDANKAVEAGTYGVFISTEGGSYYNPYASKDPVSVVTIGKADASVTTAPATRTDLTYNGQDQELVVGGTANGGTMQYSLDGATYSDKIPTGTNAGEYTVYYKVAGDKNHNDTKPVTVTVTIAKATVTAPTIAAKTYNGKKQTADVAANDLYTVTSNEGGTTVGTYNVVLTLTNPANYKWTDSEEAAKTLSFQITKATAPAVTAPTLEAVTYDPNKTLANVSLPNGWSWADGAIVPTVMNNGYDAALTVDDANYDYTGVNGYDAQSQTVTRTVTLTVKKADPTFTPPTGLSLTYDGNDQTLIQPGSTQCGELRYSLNTESYSEILPDGRDAQSYTVYYVLIGDDNYKNVQGSVTATIAKAENSISNLAITGWTYGDQAKTPSATATFGTPTFTYSNAQDGPFTATVPVNAGTWYVKAFVEATDNYKSAVDTKEFTIARREVTLTWDNISFTYDGQPHAPTATAGNLKSGDTVIVTVNGEKIEAGDNYTAEAVSLSNDNYSLPETKTQGFSIAKADIAQAQLSGSMTVRSKTAKPVTFTLPTLPKGASYDTPTVYANDDGLIGTAAPAVSGTTLSFSVTSKEKEKTATINVPVIGGNNYNNATYTLTVTSQDKDDAGVTVTASNSTVTYGDRLTVTGSANDQAGSGTWTWISSNSDVVAVSGNGASPTVTVKGAGTATITGTFENDDYLGTNTATVTVTKREVTLTWGTFIFNYDGKSHVPAVTLGNVKTGDTVNVTVTGEQTNAGTNYTATAESLDNGNYKLPAANTHSFTINKVASAVTTAPTAQNLTYTGTAQPLVSEGEATGGAMQYSLDGTNYSTTIPTGTAAGGYTVYYKVVGDENHNDTARASVKVNIAKADAGYNAPTAQKLTYTGTAQALVTAGSTVDGTMQYRLGNGTWGTTVPTATKAGTYTVYYRVTGDKNHNDVAAASVSVTIGRADITPAVSMAGWTYGGKASSPSVSGNSGSGSVTYAYKVKGADDSSNTATNPTNAGDYTVKATVAQTANYNSAAATADFTIAKADASVTAAPTAKTLTYSGTAQALVKSGSASGGKMMYQLNDGEWSTAIPTATNAGTYTVHYRVDGDSNHNSVASQSVTVTIAPKNVTITAKNATKVYGESDPNLTATVTGVVSGDTIVATASRADGNNNVGSYTISAAVDTDSSQYTVGNYNIKLVNATFTITKANASVTSAPQAVTDLVFNGQAWELVTAGKAEGGKLQYKLGNGAYGTAIPTATEAGTYTVYYKVVGDTNHNNVSEARITVTIAPLSGDQMVTSGDVTASTQPDDTINELSKLEQYQPKALGLEENPAPEQVAAARLEAIRKDMTSAAGTSATNASALYYVNAGSSAAKVTFALPASAATHNFKVMYMDASGNIVPVTDAKVTASGIEVPVAAEGDGVYLVTYTNKPVHVVDDSASASGDQSIITDLTDINKVTVDGKTVDSKYYTVSGGVVTLSEAYLRTLSNGKHTVRVENAKYVSTAVITVSNSTVKSAGTGDAGLGLYAMLALSSVTGAAWLGLKKRKED